MDKSGNDQTIGEKTIKTFNTKISVENALTECLKLCLGEGDPYSTGCEFNRVSRVCRSHSKLVSTGSGTGDDTCYVLTGLTFQSIFFDKLQNVSKRYL